MANILNKVIGSGISDVVDSVGNAVNKRAELETNLQIAEIDSATKVAVAQNKVNEKEAASEDLYTKRARPTTMYVCTAGFAYQYILQPFIVLIASLFGSKIIAPSLDMTAIGTVLLGLAGLRTVDKFKK